MPTITTKAAAAIIAASLVSSAASASDARRPIYTTVEATAYNDAPKTRIWYGDLDLSSAQDRETLNKRIHYAAIKVCARPGGYHMPSSSELRCRVEALAGAQPQMLAAIAHPIHVGRIVLADRVETATR